MAPLAERVAAADVIILGTVRSSTRADADIAPEVFLKGPAQSGAVRVVAPLRQSECPLARLEQGNRVLLLLQGGNGAFEWPTGPAAYAINDGQAALAGSIPDARSEAELVHDIRSITNLYAVPAATPSEGAGIDWVKTVVPVTVALAIVLGIGLYLMRIWHRIDPT